METIIGIAVALALGILLGYKWRDRISQQRRRRYLAEANRARHLERQNLPDAGASDDNVDADTARRNLP